MKGIAPAILILLAALAVTGAAVITTFYPDVPKDPATNSTDPVEIGATAVANVPWGQFYDYFLGGLFGVVVYIARYWLLPFMNLAATWAVRLGLKAVGAPNDSLHIILPEALGYVVIVLILTWYVWRKQESIVSFLRHQLLLALLVLVAVFIIGLVLAVTGAV